MQTPELMESKSGYESALKTSIEGIEHDSALIALFLDLQELWMKLTALKFYCIEVQAVLNWVSIRATMESAIALGCAKYSAL